MKQNEIFTFLADQVWIDNYKWYQETLKKFKSNKRHLIKSFTWRFIGTVDTFLLGWLFSGNPLIGLKIGVVETISKLMLYYIHERFWYKFDFGLEKRKT